MLSFEYICHSDQVFQRELVWSDQPELSNAKFHQLEKRVIKYLRPLSKKNDFEIEGHFDFLYSDFNNVDSISYFLKDFLGGINYFVQTLKQCHLTRACWSIVSGKIYLKTEFQGNQSDFETFEKFLEPWNKRIASKKGFEFFYQKFENQLFIELRFSLNIVRREET